MDWCSGWVVILPGLGMVLALLAVLGGVGFVSFVGLRLSVWYFRFLWG